MANPRKHTFDDLVDDNITEILLSQLDRSLSSPHDLLKLRTVSKRFDNTICNPDYWKRKVAIHFPKTYKEHCKKPNTAWQDLFEKTYQKEMEGYTPLRKRLIYALREGNLNVLKQLLITFADLIAEIRTKKGHLLPIISLTNNKSILHYLYEMIILPTYRAHGWHHSADTLNGQRTILYWAIYCHVDINKIECLLDYGRANLQERYFGNEISPLHSATLSGRVDVITLLLNKYPVSANTPDRLGFTALAYAAQYGKTEAARCLIDKGIDIDNATPVTAINIAAQHGHDDIIKLLLTKGAKTTIPSSRNGNNLPIHNAAGLGHLSCVKVLIEHSHHQLNATNLHGSTPLILAAGQGHKDVVDYLLEMGADRSLTINANDSEHSNKSAIMRAVDNEHWEIVITLLNAGDGFDKLIDYLFSTDNQTALNELILLAPEKFTLKNAINALLLRAVTANKPNITACLLQHGADAHLKDSDGYHLINLACMNGHHECLQKIVEHNSAIIDASYSDLTDPVNNKPPLFFAYETGMSESVDFLLSKMNDQQFFDALIYALQNDELVIAKKIINLKPSLLYRRDKQSKTPLMIAVACNNQAAIELCFKHNVFEEAAPPVFTETESLQRLNDCITDLNKTLKSSHARDLPLMLETQELLTMLNNTSIMPEAKLTALDDYQKKHHTISAAKSALCDAAVIAITISVIIGCMIAGAVIGALATSWSGPGAGLGALLGAIEGFSFGCKFGITTGALIVGLGTEISLFSTNNFFIRTRQQRDADNKAKEIVECATDVMNDRIRMRG